MKVIQARRRLKKQVKADAKATEVPRFLRCALGALVLSFCFSGSAEARVISLEEAMGNYPEEISLIAQCGRWQNSRESGFYKIIVAEFLFGGSRLWVQWMSDRDSKGRTRPLSTLSLEEINDDHAEFLFDGVECDETEDGIVLHFTAQDGHTEKGYHVEVKISKDYGRYSFTTVPVLSRPQCLPLKHGVPSALSALRARGFTGRNEAKDPVDCCGPSSSQVAYGRICHLLFRMNVAEMPSEQPEGADTTRPPDRSAAVASRHEVK